MLFWYHGRQTIVKHMPFEAQSGKSDKSEKSEVTADLSDLSDLSDLARLGSIGCTWGPRAFFLYQA